MGFSFCSLLGEILFAYVTTCPNIGYTVTILAKFATTPAHLHFLKFAAAPARLHYLRLKDLAKNLRNTINWDLIYW
jgi:hypothetical protein